MFFSSIFSDLHLLQRYWLPVKKSKMGSPGLPLTKRNYLPDERIALLNQEVKRLDIVRV